MGGRPDGDGVHLPALNWGGRAMFCVVSSGSADQCENDGDEAKPQEGPGRQPLHRDVGELSLHLLAPVL